MSKGPGWGRSSAGNPTIVLGMRRLTVFRRGMGWRYAISTHGDAVTSYSKTFKTEDAAQKAALKAVGWP